MYKWILAAAAILLSASFASAQTEQKVVKSRDGIVIEPVLCTGVEDRMPVGEADSFPADIEKVYLWTRIIGVTEGETTIHHVWLREGQEMADMELSVKGSPWRTYSYKTIPSELAGDWEVKVTGPDGNVLKSIPFTVSEKVEGKEAEPEPEVEDTTGSP